MADSEAYVPSMRHFFLGTKEDENITYKTTKLKYFLFSIYFKDLIPPLLRLHCSCGWLKAVSRSASH